MSGNVPPPSHRNMIGFVLNPMQGTINDSTCYSRAVTAPTLNAIHDCDCQEWALSLYAHIHRWCLHAAAARLGPIQGFLKCPSNRHVDRLFNRFCQSLDRSLRSLQTAQGPIPETSAVRQAAVLPSLILASGENPSPTTRTSKHASRALIGKPETTPA